MTATYEFPTPAIVPAHLASVPVPRERPEFDRIASVTEEGGGTLDPLFLTKQAHLARPAVRVGPDTTPQALAALADAELRSRRAAA